MCEYIENIISDGKRRPIYTSQRRKSSSGMGNGGRGVGNTCKSMVQYEDDVDFGRHYLLPPSLPYNIRKFASVIIIIIIITISPGFPGGFSLVGY